MSPEVWCVGNDDSRNILPSSSGYETIWESSRLNGRGRGRNKSREWQSGPEMGRANGDPGDPTVSRDGLPELMVNNLRLLKYENRHLSHGYKKNWHHDSSSSVLLAS
jgi:hypothetical protein